MLALLTAVAMSSALAAQEGPDALMPWSQANQTCQAAEEVPPAKRRGACRERESLTDQLSEEGYCYGQKGQRAAQMLWHECTDASLDPIQTRSRSDTPRTLLPFALPAGTAPSAEP